MIGVVTNPNIDPSRSTSGSDGRIADAANLPLFAPALERPVRATSTGKAKAITITIRKNSEAFVDVIEDVVAHLMTHHRLNFFGRAAAQQVVVERDAHGLAKAADVGAHARGLARSINRVHLFGGDPIGARQAQNWLDDFRIVERRDLVENAGR